MGFPQHTANTPHRQPPFLTTYYLARPIISSHYGLSFGIFNVSPEKPAEFDPAHGGELETRGIRGVTGAAEPFPVRSLRGSHGHYWLVVPGRSDLPPDSSAHDAFAWVADIVQSRELAIVHERLFGSSAYADLILASRAAALASLGDPQQSPLTFIEGHPPWGRGFTGTLIHCVERGTLSIQPHVISEGGVPRGRRWRRGGADYVTLQNISAGRTGENPFEAVQEVFARAERLLRQVGLDYSAVVRTWFVLSEILRWYEDFNRSRDRSYATIAFHGASAKGCRPLPASTGVGGRSVSGEACTLDLLAVSAEGRRDAETLFLDNPSQKTPNTYGSAFSRAVSVTMQTYSLFELSGTAAIDESGQSLHRGDTASQIRSTLGTVESLLKESQLSLSDLCAATAYLKHPTDLPVLEDTLRRMGLAGLPVLPVVSDICRDELLFEIDGEIVAGPASGGPA